MAKLTRSRLPQDDAQENFEQDGQDGSGFEESTDDIAPEEFPGNDRYEEIKRSDIHIAELQRLTMKELLLLARKEQVSDYTGLKKQDLIFKILK